MSHKPKSKSNVREFELNDDFKEKYPEFPRIYTVDKNLVLEHFQAGLIISKYYSDDVIRTIDALRKTFLDEIKIGVEFTHGTTDQFLRDVARLMGRRLLEDAREEERQEAQVEVEQQQRNSILEEINQLRQQHKNINPEEWTRVLQDKFQNLRNVVGSEMPEIREGLEFVLSIHRILNIQGCTLPFIGIILGRPSSYKTVIIELLKGWPNAYSTDNFTARSFVSHSTSVDAADLGQIDMLPRIKNNQFLTSELSPMFTSKDEDLTQLLGIITRIADGHGYSSDSGAHGHRGYDEDIMFTWAAAAVDIPFRVFKILNNLGHRLYYYRLQFPNETIDELEKYTSIGEDFNVRKQRVREALFDYMKWFDIGPELSPDRKIKWDRDRDDTAALRAIAGMADVLSYLRCVAQVWETSDSQGSEYAYTISQREVPRRAATALSNLARGRALLEGRNHITLDDISIVIKTAMDSAQIERVSLFNLLLAHGGTLTTTQIFQSLRIARKTALRTMAEFHVIGLVEMENFHEPGQNNVNKRMVLSPNLSWLLTDSVITKFFPQITSSFFQGDDNTISVFWSIYEGLENGNGNGDGRQGTVAHNELHEALVSSGKFYAGDATQIVEDMVKSGSLETVSFGTYKRVSGDH